MHLLQAIKQIPRDATTQASSLKNTNTQPSCKTNSKSSCKTSSKAPTKVVTKTSSNAINEIKAKVNNVGVKTHGGSEKDITNSKSSNKSSKS